MGESIPASKLPESVLVGPYRAKDIESFDTCFMKGTFDNGCEFLLAVTQSGELHVDPIFRYEYEKGVIELGNPANTQNLIATFHDGTVRDYGDILDLHCNAEKLEVMIRAVNEGNPIPCTVATTLPHLTVCNALFDQADIFDISQELRYRESDPPGTFVKGLYDQCLQCYQEFKLPSELGFSWAQKETPLQLKDYRAFSGAKYNRSNG
jgi:hypothetical protein